MEDIPNIFDGHNPDRSYIMRLGYRSLNALIRCLMLNTIEIRNNPLQALVTCDHIYK